MKIEKLLTAFTAVSMLYYAIDKSISPKHSIKVERQWNAFRDRIIKVDAQQREDIQELGTALDMVIADVEEQSNEIGKKNAEIEQLTDKVYYLRRELEEQKRVWERE